MLNKTIKLIAPVSFCLVLLAVPLVVSAAPVDIVPEDTLAVPNILKIIQALIRFILIIAFVIAFIMLIVGGIRWILAGGDEKAVASARGTITAALIGLVIVLVAYALIRLIEAMFGVTIISGEVCIPFVSDVTKCANLGAPLEPAPKP